MSPLVFSLLAGIAFLIGFAFTLLVIFKFIRYIVDFAYKISIDNVAKIILDIFIAAFGWGGYIFLTNYFMWV